MADGKTLADVARRLDSIEGKIDGLREDDHALSNDLTTVKRELSVYKHLVCGTGGVSPILQGLYHFLTTPAGG